MLTAALAVLLVTVAPEAAPARGGPRLRIVAPADGSRVSGPLRVLVQLEPSGTAVTRLSLSADGQPVCTREAPPFECDWDAGAGIRAHLLRASALLPDGTRLSATVRTQAERLVLSADAGVVQVLVTVADKHGRFLKGLTKDDFRVFEDGVRQPVSHFGDPSSARELVAALDMSSSMSAAMPRLRAAVRAFLARLRPIDRLSLLAFNDSVFTVARRESDPAARLKAVDRLAAWGGTALYDTLSQGLDQLGRTKGRKALVVFSDGEDTASLSSAADVEQRVRRSDAPLYVVCQGRGNEVAALRELMERLARLSGGRAFATDDVEELQGAFDRIAEELDAQYLLAYEPSNAARDGSWRAIKVEVKDPSLTVRAREGYRAESSEP